MPNEPKASGKKDEKITVKDAAGGKKEVDLKDFAQKLAPLLKDPADEYVSTDASRPDAAPQTPGPHRYTISAPNDDATTFNLGAPMGIFNAGIGGVTNTSVYFAARQGKVTAISLGAPVAAGPTANSQVEGFAVDTEGDAAVVAQGTALLWSTDADAKVVAGRDIFFKSTGKWSGVFDGGVNLATKKNFSLTVGEAPKVEFTVGSVFGGAIAIAADLIDPVGAVAGGAVQPVADGANLLASGVGEIEGATQIRDYVIAKAGNITDKILLHIGTVTGLVLSFRKLHKEGKEGKAGFKSADGASAVIGALAEGLKFYQDFVKASEDPNMSLKAVGTVEIASDKSCAISAPNGVGISGFKSVDVSSLAVGIKGHKDASVFGGVTASLKALVKGVTVQSDLGEVTIGGKKDVKVSSEEGSVLLTAGTTAQLTGKDVFVYGSSSALIGAGESSGAALHLNTDSLWLGMASTPDNAGSASFQQDGYLRVAKDGVTIHATTNGTQAQIDIGGGNVTIFGGSSVDLSANKNAKIQARCKILLD